MLACLAVLLGACGAAHPQAAKTGSTTSTTSTVPTTTSTTSAATTATTAAPPPVTQIDHFTPWAAKGSLASGVKDLGSVSGGDCFSNSIPDAANQYAWRCMTGNLIYDPCFAPPGATGVAQVACAQSPWSGVYVMSVSTPLANSAATTSTSYGDPWYMVLSDGLQCGAIGGMGPPPVNGVDLAYACGSAGDTSAPNLNVDPLTVQFAPHDAGPLQDFTVAQSWS
jgi:hypothetical protein